MPKIWISSTPGEGGMARTAAAPMPLAAAHLQTLGDAALEITSNVVWWGLHSRKIGAPKPLTCGDVEI